MRLINCGLGVFLDKDTGRQFEKVAGQIVPIVTDELAAELRFLKKHSKNKQRSCDSDDQEDE